MAKYICGYCGKAYSEIEDRMKCEASCAKKNNREAKLEELSVAREKLSKLRSEESAIVSRLQSIKEDIYKAERKIKKLNEEFSGESTHKGCDCKSKNTYSVNGKSVTENEFFKELNNLFGDLFD